MWILLFWTSAFAYETDNLTGRHLPLEDVTVPLSGRVDEILAEAVDWTNERTKCAADEDQARRLLARAIHKRMATDELVPDRGGLRAFGFDRYSAWIEKGDLSRRSFEDRSDIFGGIRAREHWLLDWAGVCSTVLVDGVHVGTDKLDHFFEEGYDGWRRADYGAHPDKALDWATKTELTIYGLNTSATFSFGDLRADHDGYEFYDTLLEEGSVVRIGEGGCVTQVRPFDWAEWITWEYDEVLNPPVYTEVVQGGVTRRLEEQRDEYCASYRSWGGTEYEAHLARVLAAERPDYVGADAPPRTDPYQLRALCDGWSPEAATAAREVTKE